MKTQTFYLSRHFTLFIALMAISASTAFSQGNNWKISGNNNINEEENFVGTTNAQDLNLGTNDTVRMTIKKGGNVEIAKNLKVSGDTLSIGDGTFFLINDVAGITDGIFSTQGQIANLRIGTWDFTDVQVGVGILDPKHKLHIDNNPLFTGWPVPPLRPVRMAFTNQATNNTAADGLIIGIDVNGNAEINQTEILPMRFFTSGTQRMEIDPVGNITIGTGTGVNAANVNQFAAGLNTVTDADQATAFGRMTTASGINSFAIGEQSIASGISSFAAGSADATALWSFAIGISNANAENSFSQGSSTVNVNANEAVAIGQLCVTEGPGSFVGGSQSIIDANGNLAFAFGELAECHAPFTFAMGVGAIANANNSYALGEFVTTDVTSPHSFLIGQGLIAPVPLTNPNYPSSFQVGFDSDVSTFFVGPSAGILGSTGNVGIGALLTMTGAGNTPGEKLEINSDDGSASPGRSGLRFTDLNTSSTAGLNQFATPAVLSVNVDGDVILVEDQTGVGGGVSANNGCIIEPGNPDNVQWGHDPVTGVGADLIRDTEIPLNDFDVFFTDGISGSGNRMSFGTDNPQPVTKYHFTQRNPLGTPFAEVIGLFSYSDDPLTFPFAPLFLNPYYEGNMSGNKYGILSYLNDATGNANVAIAGKSWTTSGSRNYGVIGDARNGDVSSIGVIGRAVYTKATAQNIGVRAIANGPGTVNYGILTAAYGGLSTNYGIYATVGPGGGGLNYAGYFDGDIFVDGPTSGFGYVLAGSDIQFKTSMDTITDAMQVIMQLQPKTYYWDTASYPQINFSHKKQYGFTSQDVEQILPELVYNQTYPAKYDSLGNEIYPSIDYSALSYNSFFAILTKGMKEQQGTINQQQNTIDSILVVMGQCCNENTFKMGTGNEGGGNDPIYEKLASKGVILYDAVPNPFQSEVSIGFFIPERIINAEIVFHDNFGRTLKTVAINQRGEGIIIIDAGDLASGLYTYGIIADGQAIDTKKMVRSK